MPTLTPARLTSRAKVERKDANSYYNYSKSRHYSKDYPQPKIKKERINTINKSDKNEPNISSKLSSFYKSADEEFNLENA